MKFTIRLNENSHAVCIQYGHSDVVPDDHVQPDFVVLSRQAIQIVGHINKTENGQWEYSGLFTPILLHNMLGLVYTPESRLCLKLYDSKGLCYVPNSSIASMVEQAAVNR